MGVLAAALLLVASSCSGVEEPRWDRSASASDATGGTPGDIVRSFDSPRIMYEVVPGPDIGEVRFTGTVRGRDSTQVVARADGRVSDTQFSWGDSVVAGDVVLTFLPNPSEAELIELEIARLEVERAIAAAEGEPPVAAARRAVEQLEARFAGRTEHIVAPTSGVIGSTRPGITYRVTRGGKLFDVSDPGDVVVEVPMSQEELDFVESGLSVRLAAIGQDEPQPISGAIVEVPDPSAEGSAQANSFVVRIEIADDATVALGDRFQVTLDPEASAQAIWVPLEFVHRRGGETFLLIADETGQLSRLQGSLGRRTRSHVEVKSGLTVGMRVVAPT